MYLFSRLHFRNWSLRKSSCWKRQEVYRLQQNLSSVTLSVGNNGTLRKELRSQVRGFPLERTWYQRLGILVNKQTEMLTFPQASVAGGNYIIEYIDPQYSSSCLACNASSFALSSLPNVIGALIFRCIKSKFTHRHFSNFLFISSTFVASHSNFHIKMATKVYIFVRFLADFIQCTSSKKCTFWNKNNGLQYSTNNRKTCQLQSYAQWN